MYNKINNQNNASNIFIKSRLLCLLFDDVKFLFVYTTNIVTGIIPVYKIIFENMLDVVTELSRETIFLIK